MVLSASFVGSMPFEGSWVFLVGCNRRLAVKGYEGHVGDPGTCNKPYFGIDGYEMCPIPALCRLQAGESQQGHSEASQCRDR